MSRTRLSVANNIGILHRDTNLDDLLAIRPSGLVEFESWAILCQSIQALQDLFLSDGLRGKQCIPLVTPFTLMLSSKGRVKLNLSHSFLGFMPPAHLAGYLAPEYKFGRTYNDMELEKMWIFSLGETLNQASLTSNAATSWLSNELCQVLADMTRVQTSSRASLMHLLDVMSEYCKKKLQNRPFSHVIMDLHQEALAGIESSVDTSWDPPAMPEIMPLDTTKSESAINTFEPFSRRWQLSKSQDIPRATKEVATSMEDLSMIKFNTPGTIERPRSLCVPDGQYHQHGVNNNYSHNIKPDIATLKDFEKHVKNVREKSSEFQKKGNRPMFQTDHHSNELRVRRNPVQRAASRLYKAAIDLPTNNIVFSNSCVGPEFVVRSSLPTKNLVLSDLKGTRKVVTVIMLDGQKIDVTCSPSRTTANQLLELIIQKEQIEENFLLGLSALIAGDFVFLPSDTRICKVMQSGTNSEVNLTLFLRVRFFLPSLRGIRGCQARHLLYLQLRRSILEHQLPCSFSQVIELNGLALQAEFGNYDETEHGNRDYFLLEHYVPETMMCIIDDQNGLVEELITAHISKQGLEREKAEQDFIIYTQNLPHYGGHFYTATWLLKDKHHKDIWLYISAQGINLYERGTSTSHFGPQLYEMFEWKSIQTLCYSKHYLCILPHSGVWHRSKFKKYKLQMDYKKSYFAFRLASLHHQFFLRLRTEYTSLQTLSQHFGIPIKDIKNESNSLCKLNRLVQPIYSRLHNSDDIFAANTKFKIELGMSNPPNQEIEKKNSYRRSQSVQDLNTTVGNPINDNFQKKSNENPIEIYEHGLVLDSSYFAGISIGPTEKRRGVKMGTRAFSNLESRMTRSMEAVNASVQDYLEQMSLESVSLRCSSTSISRSSADGLLPCDEEAYVLDSTIKSVSQQNILPNFQETINETLLEKLNNMSFAEERMLSTVTIQRNERGSLGLQITEGSDGNIYVQSVTLGGPAHLAQGIVSGDQVIAVNGLSLLGRKYIDSLKLIKSTDCQQVEFVISRVVTKFNAPDNDPCSQKAQYTSAEDEATSNSIITLSRLLDLNKKNSLSKNTTSQDLKQSASIVHKTAENTVEKHLTESCYDLENGIKYTNRSSVKNALHKERIPLQYKQAQDNNFTHTKDFFEHDHKHVIKNISRSGLKFPDSNNRAVIVDMIPKKEINFWNPSLDSTEVENIKKTSFEKDKLKGLNTLLVYENFKDVKSDNSIALPRSLGLSRKWKGPVRYPVTPVKKSGLSNNDEILGTSDDEQVFI